VCTQYIQDFHKLV